MRGAFRNLLAKRLQPTTRNDWCPFWHAISQLKIQATVYFLYAENALALAFATVAVSGIYPIPPCPAGC